VRFLEIVSNNVPTDAFGPAGSQRRQDARRLAGSRDPAAGFLGGQQRETLGENAPRFLPRSLGRQLKLAND
jgi:hypothetical protein